MALLLHNTTIRVAKLFKSISKRIILSMSQYLLLADICRADTSLDVLPLLLRDPSAGARSGGAEDHPDHS